MTTSAPGDGALPGGSDRRVALRSRVAGVCLALVLLAVSLFAIWSSQATSAAAGSAVAASGLSDDYEAAAAAVAGEESLERKYRLEPGPEIEVRFDDIAAAFVAALARIRQVGDDADRALADNLLVQHAVYLQGIERMFRAVDRRDFAAVLRIDREETEPAFSTIERAVLAAAEAKHQQALAQLADLERLEGLNRRLTPLVFIAGLVISAALASVTRGYRRLLGIERVQAVHNSLHDALSGLPNRTLLSDRLDQALRADVRAGTSTGLLLIDLDRFKDINDTFGHRYGDEVLSQVGPRLSGVLRGVDTVARLGGDEFAVVLPAVGSTDNALAVAAKLRATLQAPFRIFGVDLEVEASVGVVTSGEHGLDSGTLLQRADIAMYVAKGENSGVFAYTPQADKHSPAKLALLGELRRALDGGELVLHYQPKLATSTGDVVGAEALVRWQHPEHGLILPDDFIPLAEHTGLIGPLTRHVLSTALAQVRMWADAQRPLTVSVNLSARNLLDDRLPETVAELLTAHGVPARLLELEVTESALMSDPVRAQKVLTRLDALGIRISIDDFGAGYTSLSQLRTLPVSELKIDKSFVLTMTEDTSNALIVHSVIDLGHSLGLSIVAEGVETGEALTQLEGFGCDVAQGYYFCHPCTAADLESWRSDREGDRPHAPAPTLSH